MTSSIKFYNKFAPYFDHYSAKKNLYINSIDKLILNNLPTPKNKIIDIGCGDGQRGKRLLKNIKGASLLMIDNSPNMLALSNKLKTDRINVMRADISGIDAQNIINDKFNIVLCLWNVLGHIPTSKKRLTALNNMRNLLTPNGRIYIDVNNRYNIIQYGLKNVIINIIKDIYKTRSENGDFNFTIKASPHLKLNTKSHIFAPAEITNLIKQAKLNILKKISVNYSNGAIEKSILKGQLFYILN